MNDPLVIGPAADADGHVSLAKFPTGRTRDRIGDCMRSPWAAFQLRPRLEIGLAISGRANRRGRLAPLLPFDACCTNEIHLCRLTYEPSSNSLRRRGRIRLACAGGAAGRRALRRPTPVSGRRSAGCQTAALCRPGQAGNLSVHARRPVAGRYVRSQAAVDARRRQAGAEAVSWANSREPAGFALEVSAGTASRESKSASCSRNVRCIDDLCVIRSMVTDDPNHPGGCLLMNTGERVFSRPSLGAWVTYGLGTRESEPARLRGNRPGPDDRRGAAVRLQLSAGRLPRNVCLEPAASARRISKNPRLRTSTSSGANWTRWPDSMSCTRHACRTTVA